MSTSDIEDIVGLTPLQEGLHAHQLNGDDRNDPYVLQEHLDLRGPLDRAALRRAAETVVASHPGLRAAFPVRGSTGRPVQAILRSVEPPWSEATLASTGPDLAGLVAAERHRPFDLARPPLFRYHLIRLGDDHHRFVLTYHHILLDGWSTLLTLRHILAEYDSPGDGVAVQPNPYRSYLQWLGTKDRRAAEQAWRTYLAGLTHRPLVTATGPTDTAAEPGRMPVHIGAAVSARLHEQARRHDVTPNILGQVAWALLLSRHYGGTDIVFGRTVAGRPPELAGSDAFVGMFANTVPIRVRLDPDESLAGLCVRIQHDQTSLMPYEHLGLAEIQQMSGHRPLFDTHYFFQSFPLDPAAVLPMRDGLQAAFGGWSSTHYPLILVVYRQSEMLHARIDFAPEIVDETTARELAGGLSRILEQLSFDDPVATRDVCDPGAARANSSIRPVGGPAVAESRDVEDVTAQSPAEQTLIELIAEVLGIPVGELSRHDDFFELGGHSLLAARLISRIRSTFGTRLTMQSVFDAPTAAQLAGRLSAPERATVPRLRRAEHIRTD